MPTKRKPSLVSKHVVKYKYYLMERYPHRDWNAFVESLRDSYPEMYRAYTAMPKVVFEVIPINKKKYKK
jgi:hypothetical protein